MTIFFRPRISNYIIQKQINVAHARCIAINRFYNEFIIHHFKSLFLYVHTWYEANKTSICDLKLPNWSILKQNNQTITHNSPFKSPIFYVHTWNDAKKTTCDLKLPKLKQFEAKRPNCATAKHRAHCRQSASFWISPYRSSSFFSFTPSPPLSAITPSPLPAGWSPPHPNEDSRTRGGRQR